MKSRPVPSALRLLCFIFFALLIVLSCSKDNDAFEKAILDNASTDSEQTNGEVGQEETAADPPLLDEEAPIDSTAGIIYETRTTVFPAIHDAHLQAENGYNKNIVRIEENLRTSYLMFDLSQIDSIGGIPNTTHLEFTVDTDAGNGTISVLKGVSSDWTEERLSARTAPRSDVVVGELSTRFDIGRTQEISLDTALVRAEVLTLVLTHQQGNDLAFASKEHPNGKGPVLVVTYSAPQDAQAIVFDNTEDMEPKVEPDIPADSAEVTTAEEATDEATDEEETTVQEPTDEEEEITQEETTQEETTQEETTQEETTQEEPGEEETAEEVETQDGETSEDATKEQAEEGEATAVQGEEGEETENEVTSERSTTVEITTEGTQEEEEEETTKEETSEVSTTEEATTEETGEEESTQEKSIGVAAAPQNEAPNAVAEAATTSGTAPLSVSFKGSSSTDDRGIEQYVWDFRDGSTSYEADPTHTFQKTGTLEVRLTVTDAQGEKHSDTVTITVKEEEKKNEAPVAAPAASPASGEAPLEVRFTGDTSTDDQAITEYAWDFKDGAFANTANPTHTFTEPGEYKVVLSVRDEQGLSNARIVVVTVTGAQNEAPQAIASGTPLSGYAPLEVQFKGSDSKDDGGIAGYFWDFRNGATTTDANPVHTFSDPGEYEVKLDVKDEQGLTHSTTLKVTVNEPPANDGGGDTGSGGGNTPGGGDSEGGDSGESGNGGEDNGSGGNSEDNNNPSNAVNASSFGYNPTDATEALEKAINSSHSTIIVDKQSSDWVVGPMHFIGIRNKKIIFEDGVVLKAKRGAFRPEDRLFQLMNSENVEIQGYGATFAMNKSEYSGQQNHALSIINSSNITIKGLAITGAGGDGIYVSRRNHGEYSSNILIDGVTADKNSRQGMTIISVDGLQIKNSTFSGTSGESPGAGINFEPESTSDRLNNITVSNCRFKDNNGPGIMFAVNKANSSTLPIDVTFENIVVSNNSISNPRLYPCEIDLGMSSEYRTNPVRGTITFDGLRVENSRWSAIYTKKTLESYHVNVKNAVIKNVSKSGEEAAIHIGLLSYGNRSFANMGGFTFENVLIDYDGQAPSLELFGPSHNNWNLGNLNGEIRVRSPRGVRLHDNMNKLATGSSTVNLNVIED